MMWKHSGRVGKVDEKLLDDAIKAIEVLIASALAKSDDVFRFGTIEILCKQAELLGSFKKSKVKDFDGDEDLDGDDGDEGIGILGDNYQGGVRRARRVAFGEHADVNRQVVMALQRLAESAPVQADRRRLDFTYELEALARQESEIANAKKEGQTGSATDARLEYVVSRQKQILEELAKLDEKEKTDAAQLASRVVGPVLLRGHPASSRRRGEPDDTVVGEGDGVGVEGADGSAQAGPQEGLGGELPGDRPAGQREGSDPGLPDGEGGEARHEGAQAGA